MTFLLLNTSSYYSAVSFYYIVRFSITCYSTFTTSTKNNLRCGQKLVQSLDNNESLCISQISKKSNKKFNSKHKYHSLGLLSKQQADTIKYNTLFCSAILGFEKLNTNFKNRVKSVHFSKEELEQLCKQFSQSINWIETISYHSGIDQAYILQHAFQSLMNTCLHIETSTDHKLEQGFALNSVCEFISDYIEEIYIQLEEITDNDKNNYQIQLIGTKINTGLDFIEDVLHSPLVLDIHLHWFCVDRINFLIDQCFKLGEKLHERK